MASRVVVAMRNDQCESHLLPKTENATKGTRKKHGSKMIHMTKEERCNTKGGQVQ